MCLEECELPYLTTVYWRDIPAQVVARRGRTVFKQRLAGRFARAIDRAAMRAGRGSSKAYLSDWRRERVPYDGDLRQAVLRHVAGLEAELPESRLEAIVKRAGWADAEEHRQSRAAGSALLPVPCCKAEGH